MAKGRRKKRPDVIVREHGNTGIMNNRTFEPLTDAGVEWLRKHNDKPLISWLPVMEAAIDAYVNELGVKGEVGVTGGKEITLRVEIEPESISHLPEAFQHAAHDAMWARALCEVVRRALAVGDASHAATYAFQLGMIYMRLDKLRPHERAAWSGKRKAERNRGNVAKLKAAADERRKRYATQVEAEIDAQRVAGKRLNYQAACEAVAMAENCSDRTVKNATPNIWTCRAK